MWFNDMSTDDKQTIIEHLEALRKALIISVVTIIVTSFICFAYNEQLLSIIISPLSSLHEKLVVTGVTEAFFVKLKLAFMAGFVVSFPVIVWALWGFIKPALFPSERKYIYILFPVTILLFVTGVLFSYFGILRMVLKFFIYIAGANLENMFKVDQYVSFVLAFTIPFGLVFELPVIAFFLTKIGVINHQMLAKNRKYAILTIVILAAALTPGPDPISQLMMAVPMYILYEISALVAKYAKPGRGRTETAEESKNEKPGSGKEEE